MAVQSSTTKWVFIGGGVIVAALLVVFFQNYPPKPTDAAATIGAAQRYHEPQITGADVKVDEDAVTAWVQSDTFDKILKDPQARKLFTDAAVQAYFQERAVALSVVSKEQLRAGNVTAEQLRAGNVTAEQLRAGNITAEQLRAGNVTAEQLRAGNVTRDQAKLSNTSIDRARDLAKSDAVQAALSNPNLADAMRNAAFCEALANVSLRNVLVDRAQKAAQNNPA